MRTSFLVMMHDGTRGFGSMLVLGVLPWPADSDMPPAVAARNSRRPPSRAHSGMMNVVKSLMGQLLPHPGRNRLRSWWKRRYGYHHMR